MRQPLSRGTAAHLHRLAAECDRVQRAVGDLIAWSGARRGSAGLAETTLRDLQGLDRIGQLLRDLADVQDALTRIEAPYDTDAGEARALLSARLEETRRALGAADPRDRPPAPRGENSGDCEFL
ncbi:MAG: hypothetical protein AAGC86_04160 [Pseudomonadota bacterium]